MAPAASPVAGLNPHLDDHPALAEDLGWAHERGEWADRWASWTEMMRCGRKTPQSTLMTQRLRFQEPALMTNSHRTRTAG
jgi:hypothetical protein